MVHLTSSNPIYPASPSPFVVFPCSLNLHDNLQCLIGILYTNIIATCTSKVTWKAHPAGGDYFFGWISLGGTPLEHLVQSIIRNLNGQVISTRYVFWLRTLLQKIYPTVCLPLQLCSLMKTSGHVPQGTIFFGSKRN